MQFTIQLITALLFIIAPATYSYINDKDKKHHKTIFILLLVGAVIVGFNSYFSHLSSISNEQIAKQNDSLYKSQLKKNLLYSTLLIDSMQKQLQTSRKALKNSNNIMDIQSSTLQQAAKILIKSDFNLSKTDEAIAKFDKMQYSLTDIMLTLTIRTPFAPPFINGPKYDVSLLHSDSSESVYDQGLRFIRLKENHSFIAQKLVNNVKTVTKIWVSPLKTSYSTDFSNCFPMLNIEIKLDFYKNMSIASLKKTKLPANLSYDWFGGDSLYYSDRIVDLEKKESIERVTFFLKKTSDDASIIYFSDLMNGSAKLTGTYTGRSSIENIYFITGTDHKSDVNITSKQIIVDGYNIFFKVPPK